MKRYIVLLRAVMPSGRNKVPMAQLREALSAGGFENVRTYIQSGNALVDTTLPAREVEQLISLLLVPSMTLVVLWALATAVTLGPGLELLSARDRVTNIGRPAQSVVNELRLNRVGIRRERRRLHQHFEARFGWPVKRRHHQVKVHRETVHADHFEWLRADESRRRFAQRFVVRIPRRPGSVMRIDAKRGPVFQFIVDDLPRRFWHQA